MAAGGGPVAPGGRQRGVVRLAGVRRGVRCRRPAPPVSEPGEPAIRGRGAGQLHRPRRRARPGPPCGRPAECRRRPRRGAAPARPPDRAGVVLAGGGGPGVGGGPGAHLGVRPSTRPRPRSSTFTNATTAPLPRVLAVAFRRWAVEHAFRLGKQDAGLTDYEGRNYTRLLRHLTLALIVLGLVTPRTERLRGENPRGDRGAGVPGVEPAMRGGVPTASRHPRAAAHRRGHPLPSATERTGRQVPRVAAA